MRDVKKIKAKDLFPFISEIIEQGQSARILVSGSSMYPFLRDEIDSVELVQADFAALKRGDIVMIRRTTGDYVMHRIIKKEADCFYMVGDAQEWIEGPIQPNQVIAAVPSVWRKDKQIDCSNWWWRLLTGLWLRLRPWRNLILRVYGKLSRIKNGLAISHNNS